MMAMLEFLVVSFDPFTKRASRLFTANIGPINTLLPVLFNNDHPRFQEGMRALVGRVLAAAAHDKDLDDMIGQPGGLLHTLSALIDDGLRTG